jgi:hypothetical protein
MRIAGKAAERSSDVRSGAGTERHRILSGILEYEFEIAYLRTYAGLLLNRHSDMSIIEDLWLVMSATASSRQPHIHECLFKNIRRHALKEALIYADPLSRLVAYLRTHAGTRLKKH